ncbi:hypothetical protein [Flavobacterium sp.]|uniref:hypothetical protein n=1 Tax=Flavobacterium sp. TaxID=239 RepID=UPI002609B417|nr:hypothetical protein [Flavobacterium sp.]
MKKFFVLLCFIFISSGCAEKKYFEEVVSNERVFIVKEIISTKEHIIVNIPLEFKFYLNSYNEVDVVFYFEIDDDRISKGEDYLIINKKNNKLIWGLKSRHDSNYPDRININYFYKLSDKNVEELIKKYNPKRSLADLKTNKDTIHLVSYAKFRKDNPKFLKEMRKKTDSLQLSIGFKGGKQMVVGEKIKW